MQTGHRQRLYERFSKTGLSGFHDYEIIELILTFVIPRRDTKPIAKELIKQFKSVNAVLHAEPEALEKIDGLGPHSIRFLSLMRHIIAYSLHERYSGRSIISHRKDVEEYLRFHFGMRKDEFFAVLYLDNGNHVLATEEIVQGTVNQCVVYPRSIVEKALKQGANAIIIAHNHPGGSNNASAADWQITKKLFDACKLFDMALLDHIIINRDKVVSLRDDSNWPKR